MAEEEEEHIVFRSEEVNEILSATPKWILRWGISVIGILILTGLILSNFIRYPDILTADITLTTLNPPVKLVAKTNGKLSYLLVKNNAVLKAQQPVAVIENTADFRDVLQLDSICNGLIEQLKLMDTLPDITIKSSLHVGELTPPYLLSLKSVKDLHLYRDVSTYDRQIKLLNKDLVNYTDLLSKYRKQESINNEQLALYESDYNRDKSLFENKVISAREFETKKREYLTALNGNEQVKITLSNALIQINTIEKNILQLQIQDYQERAKLKSELQQNLKTLVAEIDKWKQMYLLISPIEGKISFFNVWAVNQNIKNGDELFSVISSRKQQYIGKCILPVVNSGKLAVGQKVNIKLDNYPFNENGMLQGIVNSVSEVSNKDAYALDVILTNGLLTSYNKTLVYKEEMKGKAEIITKNSSVLDRIFLNFRKLVERK